MVPTTKLEAFFARDFERACSSVSGGEAEEVWKSLQFGKVFLTGGTGFFGSWLLRLFQWANQHHNAQIEVTVLSRNPAQFQQRNPDFARLPFLRFVSGDVRNFEFPSGHFTHIIHAATEASAKLNEGDPLLMLDTITQGTRRVLDFARTCKQARLLFTSSGAVYGRQPSELTHIPEIYSGGPNILAATSAYGEGKRYAELLCAIYYRTHGIIPIIARCFAFAGPYLPMDAHFAIGNFVKDAIDGPVIHVQGDGTPFRSYMYGADLAFWLLRILSNGNPGHAYHVGSENDYSIEDIAHIVADVAGHLKGHSVAVKIAKQHKPGHLAERYVPKTEKTRSELGLRENFSLQDCVEAMYRYSQL